MWPMFSHVSIDEQEEATRVEELSDENSIGNGGKLLTIGVFSYPCDQLDNDRFQNQVDSNDDKSY